MFTGVGRGARGGRGVAGAGGGRTQRRGAARRPATGGPRLASRDRSYHLLTGTRTQPPRALRDGRLYSSVLTSDL